MLKFLPLIFFFILGVLFCYSPARNALILKILGALSPIPRQNSLLIFLYFAENGHFQQSPLPIPVHEMVGPLQTIIIFLAK